MENKYFQNVYFRFDIFNCKYLLFKRIMTFYDDFSHLFKFNKP